MPPGGARTGIALPDYFTFLEAGGSLDGKSFLENFFNPDYGVTSVALNIPAMWQEIMMPGENPARNSGRGDNSLPYAIRRRLDKLGFISERHLGGNVNVDGPRRYILRRHVLPVTIQIYRDFILPCIRATVPGIGTMVNSQTFEWALDEAQLFWGDEMQLEYFLHTEQFASHDDFLDNLPPALRALFPATDNV